MADTRQGKEPPASDAAAIEDRVRRYVDQRLGDTVETLLAKPGFYARYRVELWAFLILFTLAAQWLWMVQQSLPKPAAGPLPATTAASPVASRAAPPATTTSAAGSVTAARPAWADWVGAHPTPVKGALDGLLAETGVKKGMLSPLQRDKAAALLGDLKIGKTKDLDTGHLAKLLFEYLVKRSQGEAAATGKIDAAVNDGEYPAETLQRLGAQLGFAAAEIQLRKEEFQQQLVIAWLEKNPL
jgi:hypothetical protein